LRSLLRALGDAFTGINRADTASVEIYSMSGNSLHYGKRYSAHSANSQTRGWDHCTIAQVPQKAKEGLRQILAGRSAWMGETLGQGMSAVLTVFGGKI
jgi:hypothetical protein